MSGSPEFLKPHPEGVVLQVRAVPRSSRNRIGEALGDRLKIKIAAPPVDAAANDELIRFLAKQFGLPKVSVELIRGDTGRNKTVLLRGISVEEAAARLVR
jgi:uncharacterized protein (TIGR00251 family)